jgi:hypothetical protein
MLEQPVPDTKRNTQFTATSHGDIQGNATQRMKRRGEKSFKVHNE